MVKIKIEIQTNMKKVETTILITSANMITIIKNQNLDSPISAPGCT